MKLINILILLFSLGYTAGFALASSNIQCVNWQTGASIVLKSTGGNSYYYEMNAKLIQSLQIQGANPLGRGVGLLVNSDLNQLYFREYSAVVKLTSDNYGHLLKYENEVIGAQWIVEQAHFYFNPGECRYY